MVAGLRAYLLPVLGFGLLGCAPVLFARPAGAQQTPPLSPPVNTLTDAEREAGWELLFDGHTTDGWRGYMMDAIPDGCGSTVMFGLLVPVNCTTTVSLGSRMASLSTATSMVAVVAPAAIVTVPESAV